jgi:hypothetical protein
MARARTSADLIAAARVRAFLPDTGSLTDAEILRLAQEVQDSFALEVSADIGGSFLLTSTDQSIVSGTATYRIPTRARGATFRDLRCVASDGTEEPIPPLDPLQTWETSGGGGAIGQRTRFMHSLVGPLVRLHPTPSTTDTGYTLRCYYERSPGRLVLESAAAPIEQVSSTVLIQCESGSVPTAFDAAGLVDIIRGDGVFEPIYQDLITSAATTTTTNVGLDASNPVSSALIADIITRPIGTRQDWICEAGCTVFPIGPHEALWPFMVAATARACLMAIGDRQSAQGLTEEIVAQSKSAKVQLSPRAAKAGAVFSRSAYLRKRIW